MPIEWIHALAGGVLIGISVSLMLLWNGRVTGISGIVYGTFKKVPGEWSWRVSFLGGLLAGGLLLLAMRPESFGARDLPADWTVVAAGLLVGFGTILGSGCTSGHGVCGNSRLSPRSIVATMTFILSGVALVFVMKNLGRFL